MSIFVDTSGVLAVMSADDRFHAPAAATWRRWADTSPLLVTSNYVVLETTALLQYHLGIRAVRSFHEDIRPVIHVEWITDETHQSAITALLTASRRQLSLVDCTSFETMRNLDLRRVFTFDPQFAEQGFTCLPSS